MVRDQTEMEALAMVHGCVFAVRGCCDTLGVDLDWYFIKPVWCFFVQGSDDPKTGHPCTASPCMVLHLRGELSVR
jgi:hypothetical protein